MVKVAVMLAQGFEEIEALTVVDVLRRAGFICDMIGFDDKEKGKGKNGKENAEAPSHSATE